MLTSAWQGRKQSKVIQGRKIAPLSRGEPTEVRGARPSICFRPYPLYRLVSAPRVKHSEKVKDFGANLGSPTLITSTLVK